ncbi:hypothetical protein D5086_020929 [Populus alba]|uniref:Uncharacterized protein n=1 Tax=Populus alba TaxID=43335 RepID=A0ACC4BLF8_POPAL
MMAANCIRVKKLDNRRQKWLAITHEIDIAPNTPNAENMVAIKVLIPNIRPSLEDLKVTLYKTISKVMSRGMHPNAPITASISPKKGNIAAACEGRGYGNG